MSERLMPKPPCPRSAGRGTCGTMRPSRPATRIPKTVTRSNP